VTEESPSYGLPLKQLVIRLPDSIHRRLKAKCALAGLSVVSEMNRLIRSYLDGNADASPPIAQPRRRGSPGGKVKRERSGSR
jgi:plasmid stability protein